MSPLNELVRRKYGSNRYHIDRLTRFHRTLSHPVIEIASKFLGRYAYYFRLTQRKQVEKVIEGLR